MSCGLAAIPASPHWRRARKPSRSTWCSTGKPSSDAWCWQRWAIKDRERRAGPTTRARRSRTGADAFAPSRHVGIMAAQHDFGVGIGFLQLDVPVLELLERDRKAGDSATHEAPRLDDAEIAIEEFHFRLARHGTGPIIAVQHVCPPFQHSPKQM